MKTVSNPFIVKGEIPAPYFCDRVEESRQLVNHIINGHDVVLTSTRRIGKTGLIEHCFNLPEIKDNYYTFFIDILQTSGLREFTFALGQQIFEELKPYGRQILDTFLNTVRSLSGEIGYDPMSNMPKFSVSLGAIHNPEYTLDEIFQYINNADKRCVIAIDEFQQITRYPEKNIEAVLRTKIQHCHNADFIFAGSERHILTEMFMSYTRPFYASTSMMNLAVLNKDVYTDFVRFHFQEFGKNILPEAVLYIYDLFDGNTYCMQRTMNVAFDKTPSGHTCTIQLVEQSLTDILLEQEHAYRVQLSLLSMQPKEVLIAIAKENKAVHLTSGNFVRKHHLKSSSSVQSAVKQLLSDDWISANISDTGVRTFYVSDRFLNLWLQRNYA